MLGGSCKRAGKVCLLTCCGQRCPRSLNGAGQRQPRLHSIWVSRTKTRLSLKPAAPAQTIPNNLQPNLLSPQSLPENLPPSPTPCPLP